MTIESVVQLNGCIVIPTEKFTGYNVINPDLFQPEIYRFIEFLFNNILPDNGYDDPRCCFLFLPEPERSLNIIQRIAEPFLFVSRGATMGGPYDGISLCISCIH